jgi:hypothetical protein
MLHKQRSQSQQTVLGFIPDADGSVAQKLHATAECHQDQRIKVVCFCEEITGIKATTLKNLS